MKAKHWLLLSLAAIAAVGIGGYVYIHRQIGLLMDYCYKMKSFKVTNIGLNRIAFDLYVLLENKSKIDATINGYTFDVYINSIKIATVYEQREQYYAAQGVSEITIKVDVNPKSVFKNWQDALVLIGQYTVGDRSKISVKLSGSLSVTHAFITRSVPIEMAWSMTDLLTPTTTAQNCKYLAN